MWLNSLKVAVIEKDTQKLEELIETLPEFNSKDEMLEAAYILREALELLYTLKDETSASMKQIKKNLEFLESTHNKPKSKLDIRS